jgi:glycosyltransferase involved in cell wall biosynthesis
MRKLRSLSIVIPALNEAENIPRVMSTIPRTALKKASWDVEVIVVDNGSCDGTGQVAAARCPPTPKPPGRVRLGPG